MFTTTEAYRLAIASLFAKRPVTLSQAMPGLDITAKPSEHDLFESSAPIVRLPPHKIGNSMPLPQPSILLSRPPPPGEPLQTHEELAQWKHPFGYFVTIPRTGLFNELCYTVGETSRSMLRKASAVAQKGFPIAEMQGDNVGTVKLKGIGAVEESDLRTLKDDHRSSSTTDSEVDDSEAEAWSKYDVLRRRDEEDTLIGEDGDWSMYPDSDSSDEY
ncbi:hypothetical protein DOTSEDRAFT_28586 [Dothistroma septosporum NZE10]|uniref:Uncharacterized protein n=1 Tax=Dothistroma septosporum (strain NZE10 / CBS 128990) TaxID=675120 RepID=M2WKE2_DOTSN|nr:hypothetical protein DOTSEDRAFT_28586 [Dothistroma septosporum NZE10]